MGAQRRSEVPPAGVLVLLDLIGACMSVGPGLCAWTCLVLFLRADGGPEHVLLRVLAAPVVLLGSFLLALFALRLLAPRMRRGAFPMGPSGPVLGWYCNLGLSRAARVAGLQPVLHSFYLTRFLYWRALGGRIAFGVNAAMDVSLVDLPMLTIGPGCTLSLGVHIACHTFIGNKLAIVPVEIGRNVFLGMNCVVAPRSRIGDGAWIGFDNVVMGDEVPPGTRIENFAWRHGKPPADAPPAAASE